MKIPWIRKTVSNLEDVAFLVQTHGFPFFIEPTFVLGGVGSRDIYDEQGLREYLALVSASPERPLTFIIPVAK
jgi:carbamoylphosphate synthase large subunit